MKIFKSTFLILILFASTTFAQKAYDVEYYNGKMKNLNIRFSLANGYISACEVKIINPKTKLFSTFHAESGAENPDFKMKFLPTVKNKMNNIYLILYGIKDGYEVLPKEIHGIYYKNLKAYKIILFKR